MPFLTNADVNIKTATVAATDEILAQAMTATTLDGEPLLLAAYRTKPSREPITLSKVPLMLLRIVEETAVDVGISASSFSRIVDRVELALSIIFATPPRWNSGDADVQALGSGIRDTVMRVIEQNCSKNPSGFDRQPPFWWTFSNDMNFKAKLTRGVTRFETTEKLSDPLFVIPIQFKIDVMPYQYKKLFP